MKSLDLMIEYINPHHHSFIISMSDRNAVFHWPQKIKDLYYKKYNKELTHGIQERINNKEVLDVLIEHIESGVTVGKEYDIHVIDKEFESGFDILGDYAFFNPKKYMIAKLRKVVVDVNMSQYISLLSSRLNTVKEETFTILL